MTYTLWSHGRLLGTTDLAWARCLPRHRAGDLHPTPLGEALLPVAIEGTDAVRLELRGPDGEIVPTEDLWIQDSEHLRSLMDEIPPLSAEDPGPEWLEDLERDAFDPEREPELATLELPDLPESDEEAEEHEWPRYQVMLVLFDDATIP